MRAVLTLAFLASLASRARADDAPPAAPADDAPPSTLAAEVEDTPLPPILSQRERAVANEGPFATKLTLVAGVPVFVGLGFEQALGDYVSLGGAFLVPIPYAVHAHARVYFQPRTSPWRWYVAPGVSLIVSGTSGAQPAIPEARVGVAYRTDGGTVFHLDLGAGYSEVKEFPTPVLPVGSIGWEFANPKPRWQRAVDKEDPPRPHIEATREQACADEGPFATKLALVAGFPVLLGLGIEQALGDYVSVGGAVMLPLQDAMHAHARVYFEPRASPWRWYVAPGVSRLLEDAGSKTLMVPEARVGVAYRTDGGTVFHVDLGAGYSETKALVAPVLPVGSIGWEFADLQALWRRLR